MKRGGPGKGGGSGPPDPPPSGHAYELLLFHYKLEAVVQIDAPPLPPGSKAYGSEGINKQERRISVFRLAPFTHAHFITEELKLFYTGKTLMLCLDIKTITQRLVHFSQTHLGSFLAISYFCLDLKLIE